MAAEYQRFGASTLDLVGEGMLGLVIAARRFDPERGTRLAAYAAHWIRALLRRYTLVSRRIVGPPTTRTGRYLIANLARAERELGQARGQAVGRDTLAEHLGVSRCELDEANVALRGRDAAVGGGPRVERGSLELVSEDPSPELLVAQAEERRRNEALLDLAFARLGPRERGIVSARHLHADPPTLATLGTELGISRERVRQIEARAIHRMRDAVLESVA
jgi:RNA polymerase sigma-32 factor